MRYDDESLTGLDQAQRGRLPRRWPRRWTGTAAQRASAASGAPPAIFKISSYSHRAGAVSGRFHYISREGEVELEGRDGDRLGLEALEARAFLRAAFAENHDYVWGVHSDTEPPPGQRPARGQSETPFDAAIKTLVVLRDRALVPGI